MKPRDKLGREPLTQRQKLVYDTIQAHIRKCGFPPTIREIGQKLGIRSTNGVLDHLKALERKRYIDRDGTKSRAISPVVLTDDLVTVPIMGQIAAGQPLLASERADDTVRIDSFFLGGHRKVFALRVVGESMIGDGIFDGDYIFVNKQSSAEPGQIVVALIENEATVKRYYPEADRIRFQPSNPTMEPIFVRREDFVETQILGLVVGVYRKM